MCVARYNTSQDGLSCELCTAGTYNDQLNASTCVDCPAGYYSARGASSLSEGCVPCEGNTMASHPGSAECKRCQVHAQPGDTNTNCFCEPGFYMDWELIAQGVADGENKACLECPRHGTVCENDRIIAKVRVL